MTDQESKDDDQDINHQPGMEPTAAPQMHLITQYAPEGAQVDKEMGQDAKRGQDKIEQEHLDRQEHFGHGLVSDLSPNKIKETGGDEPHKRAGADSIDIDGKFNEHKAMDARSSVTDNESNSDHEEGLISTMTMSIT
jgi:hypothetical protein